MKKLLLSIAMVGTLALQSSSAQVFKPIKFEEDVFVSLTVGTAPTGISGNPEIFIVAGYNGVGQK